MLPEIRQAFVDGDFDKAGRLTSQNFNSPVPYESWREPQFRFGSFTTLGELTFETDINEKGIRNYRRALSVDSAYATVSFTTAEGIGYERRTFVSYPANMLVTRFTATEKGKQNFTLKYAPNPLGEGNFAADGENGILYTARLDNNQMEYAVRIRVIAKRVRCSMPTGPSR